MSKRLPPVFALALGLLAVAMLLPAGHALMEADWRVSRSFLYAAIGTGFAAGILGVALAGARRLPEGQGELATLLAIWILLPPFAALPLYLSTPQIGFGGAWFEMVAAFTTTGGSVYTLPERLPMPVHFWRALVGWFGGFVTLTAAYAILAPRRLGGFEVMTQAEIRSAGADMGSRLDLTVALSPPEDRLRRAIRDVLPIYFGLTVALSLVLDASGLPEMKGLIQAMSVVSTSGITPYGKVLHGEPNLPAEIATAVFMVLAATRLVYARATQIGQRGSPLRDRELQMMAVLVGAATAALFLRHWYGAITMETEDGEGVVEALTALWGSFFTTLSFLTTTGLTSGFWERAQNWSGLPNPGLMLLGLCAIGGGAATTAGGIKLIRAFALMRHGIRELDRLSQPHAVLGVGTDMRGLLRQGAFIAWVFVMLYVCAVFLVTIALTLTGMRFEEGLVAAVSAITNTGPAYALIMGGHSGFGLLEPLQWAILGLAMVLGRIEALVVIALFSPDVWRALRRRKKTAGKPASLPPKSGW